VSRVVYEAMVSIGIGAPASDRFQVIAEHNTENFACAPNYLGIARSDDRVIIRITWNEGRTTEQLFKSTAKGLAKAVGSRIEDVFVALLDVKRENWPFGMGVSQYAI
jgi:phenylpyruvate tautomerase PptA (4-oxalocrotonate tautomerase family)